MDHAGINHHWLPAACVSDETNSGKFDPTLASDVIFVGKTDGYHESWPWRQKLVDALKRRYGRNFKVYGHGMGMRDQHLNDLYASARIVVGDSLCPPGHANYWSDRYYETIGRGGFLIAPRIPGLEAHFTEGKHFIGYDIGDMPELYRTIDHWLDPVRVAERNLISEQGRIHVRLEHTYKDRVKQMLDTVGL